MVHIVNRSQAEQFEESYRRVGDALARPDDPDLSSHERQLLHHIPVQDGVPLTWLARHLALPKSTTSVLIKDLAARGFVRRTRDDRDERRLALVLTGKGRRRVEQDRVLEPRLLAEALASLPQTTRAALVRAMERLADAGDRLSAGRRRGAS
jgi:DNA-binding MarR family transcriptional regulator